MKYIISMVFIALIIGGGYVFYLKEGRETYVREQYVEKEVTKPILFTGDIMLGRHVEKLANDEGDEMRSFQKVRDFLKDHITIANLEGPIPFEHKSTPANGMVFSFPASAPEVVREGGITAVSLANNHMYDKGSAGQEETRHALDKGEVQHFGGYAPEASFFTTKTGDTDVVVYGITMISSLWNEKRALEVTRTLRANHSEAHLIAFMHWGDEYVTQNKYQRAFAHKLIDEGVDAIIGAHPHVVQGIEVYKSKPIFYSLGNFIFDQYWRSDLENGLLVRFSETSSSYRYDLIPIHSVRSVPYLATSTKRDQILSSIAVQSPKELEDLIREGSLLIAR